MSSLSVRVGCGSDSVIQAQRGIYRAFVRARQFMAKVRYVHRSYEVPVMVIHFSDQYCPSAYYPALRPLVYWTTGAPKFTLVRSHASLAALCYANVPGDSGKYLACRLATPQ